MEERITQVHSAVHYNECKGKYIFKAMEQSIVSFCYCKHSLNNNCLDSYHTLMGQVCGSFLGGFNLEVCWCGLSLLAEVS